MKRRSVLQSAAAAVFCAAILHGAAALETKVHAALDDFCIAAIVQDYERIDAPDGIIEVNYLGEESEMSPEEFYLDLMHGRYINKIVDREIRMLNGRAEVTGTWVQGAARGDTYMAHIKEGTWYLLEEDDRMAIQRVDITDKQYESRDTPGVPGTLMVHDNPYFSMRYPAAWNIEVSEHQPSWLNPEVLWTRIHSPRLRLHLNVRAFEVTRGTLEETIARYIESMSEVNRDFEIIEEVMIGSIQRLHFSCKDFRGNDEEQVIFFTGNEEFMIMGQVVITEEEHIAVVDELAAGVLVH